MGHHCTNLVSEPCHVTYFSARHRHSKTMPSGHPIDSLRLNASVLIASSRSSSIFHVFDRDSRLSCVWFRMQRDRVCRRKGTCNAAAYGGLLSRYSVHKEKTPKGGARSSAGGSPTRWIAGTRYDVVDFCQGAFLSGRSLPSQDNYTHVYSTLIGCVARSSPWPGLSDRPRFRPTRGTAVDVWEKSLMLRA